MAATIQIIANLQNNAASPIKALRSDIEGLGDGADKASSGFSRLQTVGAAATGALVAGVTAATVAVGAFMVKGVQMAADMEAQVSGIAAVWGTTADAISPVKDLIGDLGLDPNLKVTAVEAAQAIEMLAKNGLTMDQVLQGAAHSTVLLANATGSDFNTAASVATDVMAIFGIKAEDMKSAVDGITSVTVNSKFAIEDYALALAQGGGVASQMGVSFDDFNTALVATASVFKSGSDAGTSFKTFLQRLIPTSNEAEDVMRQLGLITDETGNRFYDAQGNMKSMGEIAGILNSTFRNMSEEQRNAAMTTLFGADAMRFAGQIAGYTQVEFEKLQKVLGDTDALEQAKTRVDNFRGAWEIFMGVIEGLQIQLGSALLPLLRLVVEFLTGQLVNAGSVLVDVFERIVEAFNMFQQALEGGQQPLQALMGLVQQIGLTFGLTMEQATNLGNAVAGVVGVIVSVVTAVASFVTQFLSWKDVLMGIAISIASFLLPLIGTMAGSFLTLISPLLTTIAVVALLRNAWERDFLGIRTAVESFVTAIANLIGAISAALSGDLTGFLNFFDRLPPVFQAIVPGILSFIGTVQSLIGYFSLVVGEGDELNDFLSQLPAPIQAIAIAIGSVLAPTFDRIKDAMAGFGDSMTPVGDKLQTLWQAVQELGATLGQALLPVLAAIGAALLTVGKFLGEVFAGLLENAGQIIGGVIDYITGQIQGIEAIIGGVVGVVTSILQGDWAGAWEAGETAVAGWVEGVRTSLDGLGQIVDGVMATLWDAVVNTINDLTGATLPSWEEFKQSVGDALGGIEETIRPILESIVELFAPTVERIKEAFIGLGDSFAPIGEKLQSLWQSFQELASAVGQMLLPVLALLGAALVIVGKFLGEVFAGLLANAGQIVGGAVDAIRGAIEGITAVVQGVVDVIKALLQGDWAGAWEAAKTAASGLKDGVEAALNGLITIVDGIMATLWNSIVNTINDLTGATLPSWEEFKQSVSDAINGAVENIRTAIAPIVDLFAPTIERIKEAFSGLGDSMAPVGDKLGVLKDAFGRLGEALQPVFDILQQIASFIGSVVLGAFQAVGSVLSTVGAIIGAVIGVIAKFLGEVLAGIINNAGTIIGGLVTAVTGIVDGITNAVQSIVDFVRAVFEGDWAAAWEAAKGYVTGLVDSVTTVLSGLLETISGILVSIWDAVVNTFNDLTGATLPSWEEFKTAVVDKFNEIKDGISTAVEGWKEAISTKIEEIKTTLTTTVEGWKTAVVDGIAAIKEGITSKIEEWKEAFTSFGDDVREINIGETIKTSIVDGIASIAESIREKVAEWAESFRTFIENVRELNLGETIVEFIVSGLETFITNVGATLSGWYNAFTTWVSNIDWYDVGYTIVDLIMTALYDFPRDVVDTLQEWGQAFFDWATDTAGELQESAAEIVESVIEGLKEFPGEVADTLQEWAQAFWDWATDTAADLQDSGTEIIDAVVESLKEFPGKVADTLREWAQAFWDWATNTAADLRDSGTEIIDAVVESLKEFPGKVADTLREWAQAFWDWATDTASDLRDSGTEIIDTVVESLKEFPGKVADTLAEWTQAFWDWVTNTASELQDTGRQIIDAIITGLKEFPTLVAETLKSWITAFATWVGSSVAQLVIIGTAIVTHIVSAFSLFWEKAVTTVSTWFTSLSTYVSGKIAELIALGSSIVEGIITGIQNMAQAVIDAAGAVIQGGIDAIRAHLGNPHSPAPALIPLGSSISEGVAFGILAGAGFVIDAIGQLASSIQVEGAKAFGEAMKTLAEGLAAGLNAILDLSAFPGVGGSFLDNLRTVVDMLAEMVSEVSRANTYGEEALKLLGTFVDVAGGIADLIVPLIVALTEIDHFQGVNTDGFTAAIAQLAVYLAMTVQHIAAVNQYSTVVLEGLSAFLDVMQQIADTVGPFLAALVDINAFGTVDLWFFHEGLAQLWYTMLMVAQKVQALAVLGTETLGRMQGFLEVIQAMADIIGPFIQSLYELNAFGTVDLWFFHEGLAQLAYVMLMVVGALAEANNFGTLALDAVKHFAETAGAIAAMIGPMIEGLISINALDGTMNEVAYHAVYFRNGVRALVDALASAAALFTTGTLQHVQQFAQTAGAIAEIIVPAVEGLMIIGTLTGDLNYIGVQATYFRNGLRTVVSALASAAELFTAGILNQVQLFAETAGKIMEVIAPAIEGFALIATLTGEVNYIGVQATYLRNGLRTVVSALASAAELFTAGLLQHTQLFADTAGAIVELIADAIEALALLAGYVAAAGLETAAASFAADLTGVIVIIVAALEAAGLLANEAIVQAGELADGLGDILGLIEEGVDALIALTDYVTASGFEASAQQFAADLVFVLITVVDALNEGGVLSNTAFVAAGELADSIGDVMGAIEDGVEGLLTLATYMSNANLEPTAQQFAADLALVLIIIAEALSQAGVLTSEAFNEAAELSDGIVDLVKMISEAVDALLNLSGYSSMEDLPGIAELFAHDLAIVLEVVVAALSEAGVLANIGIVQAGELGDGIKDMMSAIGEGVEALTDLASYNSIQNLRPLVDQFAADLATVIVVVAEGLEAAGVLTSQAVITAGGMSDGIKALLSVIAEGVEALTNLASYVSAAGLRDKAAAFAADLGNAIITLAEGLQQAGVLSSQAVAIAAIVAENIGSLLDVISGGIEALAAVAEYTSNSGLQGKIAVFAADLAALTGTLATALSEAAAHIDQEALTAAAKFATDAAAIAEAVKQALDAMAAIAQTESLNGLSQKIDAFAAVIISVTILLANGLSAAAQTVGQEAMAAAAQFATDAAAILSAVSEALAALAAIGEHQLANGLSAKIQVFAQELINTTTFLALGMGSAAARLGQQVITDAAAFATDAAAILSAVSEALTALVAIGEHQLANGLSAKIQAFAQELIAITTFLALGMGSAAARLGQQVIADATAFAADAKTILDAVGVALTALVAIGEHQLANGLSAKIQAFAQELINTTTYLALGMGSAAAQLGQQVITDALAFAADAKTILDAVGVALTAMTAIGEHQLTNGLSAKIQAFAQELINTTTYLALGMGSAAAQLGEQVIAAAIAFAAHATTIAQAVDTALEAITAIAANEGVAGMSGRIQALGQELVAIATFLATSLAAAAQHVTANIVAAATQFAISVAALADEVQAALASLGQLAGMATPNIQPVLNHIVTSAQQIQSAFTAAGDIGQAVQYAAVFRLNLEQLVREVQMALAQLDALARGNAPGSIQVILDAMVNAMRNAIGAFNGAGEALGSAVEDGFRSGDYEGAGEDAGQSFIDGLASQEGAAVNTTESILSAMFTTARAYAGNFVEVGRLIIEVISSGIQSTGQQVTSALLAVLQAAINAARTLLGSANQVGNDLGRAAADGMTATRSLLDAAGASAGSSLIEGLRRAIANGQSSVVNQIIATVRAAIQAAQNALGINSPSRVFYRIGEFLTEGFRRGVEVGMAPVIRAVGRMARDVVNTVESGLTVSVPSVQLAGALLPAPVTTSGITPRYSTPAPIITPTSAALRPLASTTGGGDTYWQNDIQVSLTFPGGTSATAADIKKAVQAGIEEAMLNSGRRADAGRRLR